MTKPLNLLGSTFGKLKVLSREANDKFGKSRWLCECLCGKSCIIHGSDLKRGKAKSCGCVGVEKLISRIRKHGMAKQPIYNSWSAMKGRCLNKENSRYSDYGGRGITVCDRWLESFENFLEDMGETHSNGLELDRKDVDGNYSPENCRWVTSHQNTFNTRSRKGSVSKYKGVSMHSCGKWDAKIRCNHKSKHLGLFILEEDAARAYNVAAKEIFGEYAHLNKIGE